MKTNILLFSTVLAATAALVSLVPLNALADAGNVLLAAGVLAVFAIDYRRTFRPLAAPAQVLAFAGGAGRPVELSHAA